MDKEKKSNLYTKKGDSGKTHLASMKRVSKSSLRLETYGTVDELNANLGVIGAMEVNSRTKEIITLLQHNLFVLGSDLAFEEGTHPEGFKHIEIKNIQILENFIDELDAEVPKLQQFILPGGTKSAAQLHIARTVCRRAERLLVRFLDSETCNELILPYLNRLSDLLFIMARFENFQNGIEDIPWEK